MNNCKECDKPATIGSYCLAHHLERTNAIITAQFAIERATTAERERDELLAALDLGQMNCDAVYEDLRRERDEASAELKRVKAERDAAIVKIKVLFNVAHDAVGHVAAANYPERESLAHKWIDDEYERKP